MPKKRLLPENVSSFRDRHGKLRIRFRKVGASDYYFKSAFGTEEFRSEYRHCLNSIDQSKPVVRKPVKHKSVDDLVTRYFQSGDFKGTAKSVTLRKRRAILSKFRKEFGDLPADKADYVHLDKIVTKARLKTPNGSGGDFAAEKLRKELKRLFKFAVKLNWIESNPMDHVEAIKLETDGFHTWTEDEIKQFQNHWRLGSRERLAMEIMLWTGKRVSDTSRLGPKDIVDGYLNVTDQKTSKPNKIPVAGQVQKAIDAMDKIGTHFVLTKHGKPYSKKSFSQTFSRWCNEAGLQHCSGHGLRKAILCRLADSGATNTQMKAISQHASDSELVGYIEKANQKVSAEQSIDLLTKNYR